jgi:mannosyltransferase
MTAILRRNWIWITIFALAAGLRLLQLGTAELWYDEAGTVWMAQLPFDKMVSATASDTHPPFYLAVMWGVIRVLGQSEIAVRLPSVILSLASLWLVYQIARHLALSRPAIVAVLVWMAVSSFQIHYAQEARMYALLQAEVLLLVLAMLRRWWWVAGLTALALIYTHNYAVFYLPVIGLAWLWNEYHSYAVIFSRDWRDYLRIIPRSRIGYVFLTLGIPVLLFVPWAFVLLGQMQNVSSGYWIQPVTLGGVIYAVYMLFAAFAMPEIFQPIAVMVYIGAVLFALWSAIKYRPAGAPLLIWLGLAPLALAVLCSIVWKPLLLFRGLIGSAPFLYLLVAWALTNIQPARRLYVAVLVVPVVLAGLIGYYLYGPANKGNVRATVARVMQSWTPGDIIYHVNAGSMLTWHIYAPNLPQYVMPPCPAGERTIGDLSDGTKLALGLQQVPDLDSVPHRRAFVVWGEGPTSSTCEDQRGKALLEGADPFEITQDTDIVLSGIWTRYAKHWPDSQASR